MLFFLFTVLLLYKEAISRFVSEEEISFKSPFHSGLVFSKITSVVLSLPRC